MDIPGEPSLTKTTGLPPIRVPLPLEGRLQSGPFWFLVHSLFGLFGLTLLFVVGCLMAYGRGDAFTFVIGPVVLLPVLAFSMNTISYYRDLTRRRPILLIDERGLWDRRSADQPLLWSDVASAKALRARGEYAAVDLRLRRPFAARRRPRSPATLRYLFRRRADELIVSLEFLRDSRSLALVIAELVKRHGGDGE